MRLIDTETFELVEFPDPVTDPYAILSHTWTDDEVTFRDMQDLRMARAKRGFAKIEATCILAISNGLRYAWVDTCCIDKSSSAELSEAINSMFSWYKNAIVCYAFLYDLPRRTGPMISAEFRRCRWFTRGWTLQELIASANIMFYDEDWNLRGTKMDLWLEIKAITGVSRHVLDDSAELFTVPLATRMSWAAGRQTSRVEDLAYCLMGIFDVNMPLIYGEGRKAFIRLQEEILKKTTDLSIFAWQTKVDCDYRGILAESPAEFSNSGTVVLSNDQFRFRDEIRMTNKGVNINTALQYFNEIYVMDLHCYNHESRASHSRIGVYLKRTMDTYYRCLPHRFAFVGAIRDNPPCPIFLTSVADEQTMRSTDVVDRSSRIYLKFLQVDPQYRVHDIKAVPDTYWHTNEQYFSTYGFPRFRCFVRFSVTSRVPTIHQNAAESPNSPAIPYDEVSSQVILFCDLVGTHGLKVTLYSDEDLHLRVQPDGFICPFRNIERYGPLGDPYSLSVLSPRDQENRRMWTKDGGERHNFVATADTGTSESALFQVNVNLNKYESHAFPTDILRD